MEKKNKKKVFGVFSRSYVRRGSLASDVLYRISYRSTEAPTLSATRLPSAVCACERHSRKKTPYFFRRCVLAGQRASPPANLLSMRCPRRFQEI